MLGEQIRQGFSPLLAVLTSDAVERIAAKNNLSFTDLLLPFATVNCTVKVTFNYVFITQIAAVMLKNKLLDYKICLGQPLKMN